MNVRGAAQRAGTDPREINYDLAAQVPAHIWLGLIEQWPHLRWRHQCCGKEAFRTAQCLPAVSEAGDDEEWHHGVLRMWSHEAAQGEKHLCMKRVK